MSKIRVALVDDELTSRNTIKKILENHELYEVVADFSSGSKVLDWLRTSDIDILLCDMQMPEINGVELIRSIHIIDQYLPVIVISGFDDFNFVKGSLVNGAANYLLKHELTKETLIQALDQVREKYRITPEAEMVYRKIGYYIDDEKAFSAESIWKLVLAGEIDFSPYNVIAIAIGPDYKVLPGLNYCEYKQDICNAIMDMLNQMLAGKYQYLIYRTREWQLVLLLSFSGECSTLMMLNTVNNLLNRLQRQIIRMLDITVTLVSGNIQKEIEGAVKESAFLQCLLQDKLYLGGNRTVMASIAKQVIYNETRISENLWRQLRFELESNVAGALDTIHSMFELMETERVKASIVVENCKRILALLVHSGYLTEPEGHQQERMLETYELFEQFRSGILQIYGTVLNKYKNGQQEYSDMVCGAIEYIRQNYANDISLEHCAELLGCSYSQISRSFKKETGIRFVEFLNRQRINRAKGLLLGREYSMKEIAELSGFRNYNYFFKVFKETEGVTPSEFITKI